MPLPPLPEQRRIAAKIDHLMARCDELEQLRTDREHQRLAVHAAAIRQLLDAPDGSAWDFIQQHFAELYSVKENVAELRKAILQLAITGKLVPQDSNDPPARKLVNEIEAHKQLLPKVGKNKKPISLPPIKQEEIPYELPHGWEWKRLPDITFFQEGPGILAKDFRSTGIPLIRIAGMHADSVSLDGCNFLDESMVDKKWSHFRLDLGDVVLSSSASLGKVSKVGAEAVGCIPYTGLIRFKTYSCILDDYLIRFFSSSEFLRQINQSKTGAAIKHFGPSHLKRMIIPLPPLAEQQRIIARIRKLMTLCDSLDQQIDLARVKQVELLNAVMAHV